MSLLAGARLVTPAGIVDGWLETSGQTIAAIGAGEPARPADRDLAGQWVVPGFVDMHVHGGGGHTFTTGDPDGAAEGVRFHLSHGTTTTLLSLVTAPTDDLEAAAQRISEWLTDAAPAMRRQVAGIHAEGPFLSAARCGAQDPEFMTDPDPEVIAGLAAAAGGCLRMMTIAPERPGALDAIGQLAALGVIAAIGHTDATFDQAGAAITAGATVATHLGNAMSPLQHRDPGVVGACLTASEICCELIVDGHHLHPAFVQLAAASKGAGGIVLITDAMAAAGAGDGRYRLGRLDVDVRDGKATLASGGSLAGSTLTMDTAFRNAVAAGVDAAVASRAASLNPARLLGISDDVGTIEAGKRADLVVLDEELEVCAVVASGEVVSGSLDGS
jgi:N-acetylglucosamine-6-phosphate deacetylase